MKSISINPGNEIGAETEIIEILCPKRVIYDGGKLVSIKVKLSQVNQASKLLSIQIFKFIRTQVQNLKWKEGMSLCTFLSNQLLAWEET